MLDAPARGVSEETAIEEHVRDLSKWVHAGTPSLASSAGDAQLVATREKAEELEAEGGDVTRDDDASTQSPGPLHLPWLYCRNSFTCLIYNA